MQHSDDIITINNNQLSFISAENLLSEGLDSQAKDIYLKLLDNKDFAPLSCYRLGEIENRNKNIEKGNGEYVKNVIIFLQKIILRI